MLDPFPHLHVRPPSGWINDPNGIGRWDGRWHVAYQHNPAAPVWGDIRWGHASSSDLLTWRDEPALLVPRAGAIDAAGVWSGVAVADDEGADHAAADDGGARALDGHGPALVYTAVPTGAHDAGVAVARRAPDGTFTPGDVFVAGPPTDPTVVDVRDPFLVRVGGRRYAIQGGGRADRSAPLVPLWAVDRLDDWRPLGFLVADDDPATLALAPAQLWECPQLVRLPAARSDGSAGDDGGEDDGGSAPSSSPGTWVLLVSRWADGRGLDEYAVVGDVVARGDGLRFVGRAGGPLDEGPLLYAAQAVPDGERVLVWAWAPEPADRTPDEVAAAGWAGTLTFPRELTVAGDRVLSAPARELTGLRAARLPTRDGQRAVLDEPAWEVVARGEVRVELLGPSGAREVWRSAGPARDVRVLVDGSLLEAFADGRVATHRVYPGPDEVWQVHGDDVTAWRLAVPGPGPGPGPDD